MTARPELLLVSPLPPERNGIADYAYALAGALSARYSVAVACADWRAGAPAGIAVIDPALAHRHVAAGGRVLHQLGNNAGHAFVLRLLRRLPGVVTLHDPGLLHLHEVAGEPEPRILAGLAASRLPAGIGARFAALRAAGGAGRADHALFDLAAEVLSRATVVVVHSRYARARLVALHGAAVAAKIAVIPHPLLPAPAPPTRAAARAALGLSEGRALLLTAGFATRAKRLDWMADAVAGLLAAGRDVAWVHAGPEASEDHGLADRMAALGARARVTGWLEPAELGRWLAAADAFVNLRFPSQGESSGALMRAMAAGLPCLVSDTAAYAELPRDAVRHVPVAGGAGALADTLRALLLEPGAARALGDRARAHVAAEGAAVAVAAAYAAVIEAAPRPTGPVATAAVAARADPVTVPVDIDAAGLRAVLAGRTGRVDLLLRAADLDTLARTTLARPGLLANLLPAEWRAGPPRIRLDDGAGIGAMLERSV